MHNRWGRGIGEIGPEEAAGSIRTWGPVGRLLPIDAIDSFILDFVSGTEWFLCAVRPVCDSISNQFVVQSMKHATDTP